MHLSHRVYLCVQEAARRAGPSTIADTCITLRHLRTFVYCYVHVCVQQQYVFIHECVNHILSERNRISSQFTVKQNGEVGMELINCYQIN